MGNRHTNTYLIELEDGRILEANKNSVSAWTVRVNNNIIPNVYETSHVKAFEKAKEILGVKND